MLQSHEHKAVGEHCNHSDHADRRCSFSASTINHKRELNHHSLACTTKWLQHFSSHADSDNQHVSVKAWFDTATHGNKNARVVATAAHVVDSQMMV